MNKQDFQSIQRTHRFAISQRQWSIVETLEYMYPFLSKVHHRAITTVPQSRQLRDKLGRARVARRREVRKQARKQARIIAEIKAYWEEAAYYGRR